MESNKRNLSILYSGSINQVKEFLKSVPFIETVPIFDQVSSSETVKNILFDIGEFSILYVRCTSCGKVLGDSGLIIQLILNGYKMEHVLTLLGYTRYCCRNVIISSPHIHRYVDYYENMYEKYLNMSNE